MANETNEHLKFYRLVKVFIEGGKPTRRTVNVHLEKSPTVYDNLYQPCGAYHAAVNANSTQGLSLLEILATPTSDVSGAYRHYVIEFEGLPNYKPQIKHEYRAIDDVEEAIGKSMDFSKQIRLYGVEMETIKRPRPENRNQQKKHRN